MKIYIANCTQQTQNFVYRVLGQPGVRQQMIDVGRQIKLSGDMAMEEIEYIVGQHTRYGMMRDTDVSGKRRGFNGLVYAIDRPVSVDNMTLIVEFNREALIEQGQKLRKEAAVAVTQAIEGETNTLSALELSVVEEERPGHTPTMAEGLRVTREEGHGEVTQSGGRNRRRNAR